MNKKPIIGGIILVAIIGVVYAGAQINPDNPENGEVWSTRIVGSDVSYSGTNQHLSEPTMRVLQTSEFGLFSFSGLSGFIWAPTNTTPMMAARIIPPIIGFLLTEFVMFTSKSSHRNFMHC